MFFISVMILSVTTMKVLIFRMLFLFIAWILPLVKAAGTPSYRVLCSGHSHSVSCIENLWKRVRPRSNVGTKLNSKFETKRPIVSAVVENVWGLAFLMYWDHFLFVFNPCLILWVNDVIGYKEDAWLPTQTSFFITSGLLKIDYLKFEVHEKFVNINFLKNDSHAKKKL